MFTEKDLNQIKNKGISLEQVEAQVSRIKNGMSYSNLISAATIGHGIEKYNDNDMQKLIESYHAKQDSLDILKFVPASGAATRMFKFLFQFLNKFNPETDTVEAYAEANNDKLIKAFFDGLEGFPFYETVMAKAKALNPNFDALSESEASYKIVETVLSEEGLNYSFLPKGLLPFHKYEAGAKTPFQEHLMESKIYASSNGKANLHFTVSEKHHEYFKAEFEAVKTALEAETGISFNVTYSYQNQATETLALTTKNEIFRKEDGSILFRPAGHGALLENLNELDSDIIFIKNIDNIVVLEMNKDISNYKKVLAAVLLEAQEQGFAYLNDLDSEAIDEAKLLEIAAFIKSKLNVVLDDDFDDFSKAEKVTYLKDRLNRPIRVCGMVKNEGEPGGGPFWVKDKDGNTSLQVVEFAQIDEKNSQQNDIVQNATHFNPTDLVCGVKNYKGEKFDLMQYVDPEAAFITMKTQNGIDIQALELPGLWNGSMAYWNSIFVEVPVETFNPVKTVNDLLKPVHQV
ncbi:NAD metabolism ATPase/kinase [Tamlana sedimentorum]|uniref:NAD metabolism ATPase/kinase n=1 Tax=Neotamlana sedimentorum TaxID=1435349 RepID=A0A0D7W7Y7_9FLAO|nr:DUF4301 family protein [Tamlana sedimentorum]KJD35245.1 NAD metabolism ATPase/kinase [Tamlana sedimentorum]